MSEEGKTYFEAIENVMRENSGYATSASRKL